MKVFQRDWSGFVGILCPSCLSSVCYSGSCTSLGASLKFSPEKTCLRDPMQPGVVLAVFGFLWQSDIVRTWEQSALLVSGSVWMHIYLPHQFCYPTNSICRVFSQEILGYLICYHKSPSRQGPQEPLFADELRHRDMDPKVRCLRRTTLNRSPLWWADRCQVWPTPCCVAADSHSKKRRCAQWCEICDSLFCGKWEGGGFYWNKEGFWGEGGHQCARSRQMGETFTEQDLTVREVTEQKIYGSTAMFW